MKEEFDTVEWQRDRRSKAAEVKIAWGGIDLDRRMACAADGELFSKTYLGNSFYLPFADLHREIYGGLDGCVSFGGRQAIAAPRGSGKTTICLSETLRAILNGLRRYIVYLCETTELSQRRLDIIKRILEKNALLNQDYPEICNCVRALEGRPQRSQSQHVKGAATNIVWKSNEIVLPKVAYPEKIANFIGRAETTAARVVVNGIEAGVRGLIDDAGRPDLVIIDDPQGDESASSLTVLNKRRKAIKKGLSQLGAMGSSIAMFMLCTIIEKNDIADEFTDQAKEPAWNGLRFKFLEKLPNAKELWEEYVEKRKNKGKDRYAREAHEFYLKNRAEMDAGAVCTLPMVYSGSHVIVPLQKKTRNLLDDGSEIEASAVQHAYNVIADDGMDVFLSEYQNEPIDELEDTSLMSVDQIAQKVNGLDRYIVPLGAQTLTAYIDVQEKVLYYLIAAYGQDGTCAVIDYGVYPGGNALELADVKRTLKDLTGAPDQDGAWYQGLAGLTDTILRKKYFNEAGNEMTIERCGIDANYGRSTDTVYLFCRQSEFSQILIPCHGIGIGAANKPISEYRKTPGEKIGHGWMYTRGTTNRAIRHLLIDTNTWKSYVHDRLTIPVGSAGNCSFYKGHHHALAEQLRAESRTQTMGRGRTLWEWRLLPGRDNHLLDCLAGATAIASYLGYGIQIKPKKKERRVLTQEEINRMQRR